MMNLKLKKFGRKGSKSEGSEGATASGDGSQTGQTTPSTPPEGSTIKGLGSRVPTNMPRNSLSFANINPATSTTRHTKERSSHSKSVRLPVENLPSMRDVPAADRQVLFIKKLNFCSQLFDFTDPSKNTKEKDTKRQNLLELVDYITSGGGKFSEAAVEELTKMVAANLFRSFPPPPYDSTGGDSNIDVEEEEPTLDPAWPHLQVVYEFLLRFIISTDTDSKIASKYMDQNFIIKILKLFESEDPREREYLKTILHRIYGKFMAYRPFLRKAINNVLIHFVFETEKHNGIAELLEVLGSIINGFALPLKDEHKQFLNKVLIPLHKPKSLLAYHQQLAYCTTQFVEKDPKLAENVIRGLLKYWPVTNSPKEVLFLNELEELLEATKPEEFQKCMVPLFQRIAQSINSPHFQVSERALFLWNNDHIVNLIAQNREVILPIIFSSLEKNVKEHWSQPVNGLTMNVRKIFLEMDPDLFKQCETRYYENLEKEKEAKKKREETWKRLEEAAAANSKA